MATSPVMRWLAHRVPITLLCDLLDPTGPESRAIYLVEPEPADPVWLEAATPAGRRRRADTA